MDYTLTERQSILMSKILAPASVAIGQIEMEGIRLDLDAAVKKQVDYQNRINKLYAEIKYHPEIALRTDGEVKDAGDVNFNSTKQLREFLYGVLQYPVLKKTKKKKEPSTDKDTLEELSELSEDYFIPRLIIEYRKLKTLRSTFLVGMLKLAVGDRVYPNYWMTRRKEGKKTWGTKTGRLSSSTPNFQNIPRDSDIKEIFLPDEGHDHFVEIDFSQIEIRVAGIYGSDENMRKFFESGLDFHSQVALSMYNMRNSEKKTIDEVTKEERQAAKEVSFGVLFGMAASTLAVKAGVTEAVASDFIRIYLNETFPDVGKWRKSEIKRVQKTGSTISLFGRVRNLRGYDEQEAARRSVNTPIQSTASDICIYALSRVSAFIHENNLRTRLRGTVHDSMVLSMPDDELGYLKDFKNICEDVDFPFIKNVGIPFVVDIKIGRNWGDMMEVEM